MYLVYVVMCMVLRCGKFCYKKLKQTLVENKLSLKSNCYNHRILYYDWQYFNKTQSWYAAIDNEAQFLLNNWTEFHYAM